MAADWKCANYTLKMSALNWSKTSMNHIRHNHILILFYEQSNRTPWCSQKVSAAGLPWLEHFRVHSYTWVKSLLVGFRRKSSLLLSYKTWSRRLKGSGFCVADLAEVEFCGFLKKLYPQGWSQTSVYQSWTPKHAFTSSTLVHYARNISPMHGSALNIHNDFI